MRFSQLEMIETKIFNTLKLIRVTFSIPKQVVELVYSSLSIAQFEELEKQGICFCETSLPQLGELI